MNETIRDYIKKRVRWCMAVAIGGWLLFALNGVLGVGGRSEIFIFIGFAAFAGAALASQWLIRCPRCSTRLGQAALLIAPFWSIRKPMNFCPYCGVSLDEPRTPGHTTASPFS